MGRLLKYLLYLAIVGALVLAVYALVSDLPAPSRETVIPVTPQGD